MELERERVKASLDKKEVEELLQLREHEIEDYRARAEVAELGLRRLKNTYNHEELFRDATKGFLKSFMNSNNSQKGEVIEEVHHQSDQPNMFDELMKKAARPAVNAEEGQQEATKRNLFAGLLTAKAD